MEDSWETNGKLIVFNGKLLENSWNAHGQLMENSWKTDEKTHGELMENELFLMENYWKTHRTPIGNPWKIHGKLMKNRIPNVSQPQSAERAERSEASGALPFTYAFRRSENASRCSGMPPDA